MLNAVAVMPTAAAAAAATWNGCGANNPAAVLTAESVVAAAANRVQTYVANAYGVSYIIPVLIILLFIIIFYFCHSVF